MSSTVRLVLASASPRRREIMTRAGYSFECITADIDESTVHQDDPRALVSLLARAKAHNVASKYPEAVVVGADTLVEIDGTVLGKPTSESDAISMLRTLSGRTHAVHTGVCVCANGFEECFSETTRVTFWDLDDAYILPYVRSGEPLDKAGSYGIQEGAGCLLVRQIEGDYFNVVGLPIARLARVLDRLDVPRG